MKVKAIAAFFGGVEGRYIKIGEILDVDEERGKAMVARKLAEPVRSRKRRKPKEDKAKVPTEDK